MATGTENYWCNVGPEGTDTFRYTFTGKPAVSNMSGTLLFNHVQHHQTILALLLNVDCTGEFIYIGTAFMYVGQ